MGVNMIKWINKMLGNELIRYIISGGLVTFTNAAVYFVLLHVGLVYTVANIISIVLAKVAAYLLNKLWVYRSQNETFGQMLLELFRYILARGFTGLVDFFGLIFIVEFMGMNERVSKIVIMLVVIVLNYILGKKAVFIKKEK